MTIVVGIDGSPSSKDAATYAAQLAQRRQLPLQLVCTYQWPVSQMDVVGLPIPDGIPEPVMRAGLEPMLEAEVKRLQDEFPDLADISARLVNGNAAQVLIALSEAAQVTVVGCRGLGGFAELLLGSVSAQVAMHAHGPVIVLRPEHDRADGPILVGYDGSPSSAAALEFAATEAKQRKTTLIVVNVYDDTIDRANEVLATAAVAYTDLHVELRAVHALDSAYQLVYASREAALTVVGSRGIGGFVGLLLGSVTGTLIHHGHSPVAIIHTRKDKS